jgi:hypothetical protein
MSQMIRLRTAFNRGGSMVYDVFVKPKVGLRYLELGD